MAAPVVQSVSIDAMADQDSLSFTKPTGLAEGDLMIVCISSADDGSSGVAAVVPPADWSTAILYPTPANGQPRMNIFYKEADGDDVAETNFTFDVDDDDAFSAGVMMRVTGAANANPYLTAATAQDNTQDTTLDSGVISLNTLIPDSLLIMMWCSRNATAEPTTSAYTVSGTNPTWTERLDTTARDTLGHLLAVATAVIETPRVITSATATTSTNTTNSSMILAVFPPATPATATPDSTGLVLDQEPPTLGVKVHIEGESTAIKTVQSAPTAQINIKTAWTNEAEANTTWVNEE